jgi:hypothetical protein
MAPLVSAGPLLIKRTTPPFFSRAWPVVAHGRMLPLVYGRRPFGDSALAAIVVTCFPRFLRPVPSQVEQSQGASFATG